MDVEACRYCGVQLDALAARQLNEEFQRVTDAVTIANTLKQSIWGALTVGAMSRLSFAIGGRESSYPFGGAGPGDGLWNKMEVPLRKA